jgi:hypothetical protein
MSELPGQSHRALPALQLRLCPLAPNENASNGDFCANAQNVNRAYSVSIFIEQQKEDVKVQQLSI